MERFCGTFFHLNYYFNQEGAIGRVLNRVWPDFFITLLMPLFMPSLPFSGHGYERHPGKYPLQILHQNIGARMKFREILEEDYHTFLRNLEVSHGTVLNNG
ncbi:hypothetical protein [Desulfoferrobacter suflitae]|uniref:hypothetical protein n=1 Tax=Desulfoferrobacter suflitae TaxID=2865782 RepID=UPI00216494B4|nr:hypothetical protein [Desulfoferrobacter suflitae]MCK8600120.1 hypothetical protein [Desulfoferrobacter suflitae]